MPLFRRLPKRGFSNAPFQKRCEIVNVWQLERFDDGDKVGVDELSAAGLVGGDGRVAVNGRSMPVADAVQLGTDVETVVAEQGDGAPVAGPLALGAVGQDKGAPAPGQPSSG